MRRFVLGLGLCGVLVMAGLAEPAFADRVAVESRSIAANTSASIGVYMENAEPLRHSGVPLVFRAGENDVYPTSISGRFNPSGRLPPGGFMSELTNINGFDVEDGMCKSGAAGGFGTIEGWGESSYTLATPDDPDALFFHRSKIVGANLPAGTDFPIGTGQPSMIVDVTMGGTLGTFEIDTTCFNPSGHLMLVLATGRPVDPLPFEKGLINVIECVCQFQGDLNQDGARMNTDLALLIDALFVGGQVPDSEPTCPAGCDDLDCDGFATVLDMGYLIDHLFAGGPEPCDPCACASYPDNCP